MKKIVTILLMMAGLMVVSGTCSAGKGSDELKRMEKVGDRIAGIFLEKDATPYSEYKGYFTDFKLSEAEAKKQFGDIKGFGTVVNYRLEDFHIGEGYNNMAYLLICKDKSRLVRLELALESKNVKVVGLKLVPLEIVKEQPNKK